MIDAQLVQQADAAPCLVQVNQHPLPGLRYVAQSALHLRVTSVAVYKVWPFL